MSEEVQTTESTTEENPKDSVEISRSAVGNTFYQSVVTRPDVGTAESSFFLSDVVGVEKIKHAGISGFYVRLKGGHVPIISEQAYDAVLKELWKLWRTRSKEVY